MKLHSLTLNNFQSYDDETVEFDTGVSILYGENGAGKSTLLRGIFAALFQTQMKNELTSDINIGGLVNKHADSGSVELTFSDSGTTYTVFWEITISEEDGERRGRTKTCTLTAEDGSVSLSKVTEVSNFITELLGLDAQAFVNSVYVQQEELTKLLTADTDTRREIFDRLLGLEQIDSYIERMDKARREVKSLRNSAQTRKEELSGQKSEKTDKAELERTKRQLEKKLSELTDDIEELREKRDALQEERAEIKSNEDEISSLESQKAELNEELDNAEEKLGELYKERTELETKLTELRETIPTVDTDKSLEELQETVSELRTKRGNLVEKQNSVQQEITKKQSSLQQNLSEVTSVTEKLKNREGDARELQQREYHLEESYSELVAKQRDLVSRVPQVAQPVTQSNVEEVITNLKAKQSSVESELESITETITELQSKRSSKEGQLKSKKTQKDALEDDLDLPEAFDDASLPTETLQQTTEFITSHPLVSVSKEDLSVSTAYNILLTTVPSELKTNPTETKSVADATELYLATLYYIELMENEELEADISNLQSEIDSLNATVETLTGNITQYQQQSQQLDDTVTEISRQLSDAKELRDVLVEASEVEAELSEVSAEAEQAASDIEDLQAKRDKLLERVSEQKDEIDELSETQDELMEDIDEVEQQIEDKEATVNDLQERRQVTNEIETVQSKKDAKHELYVDTSERVEELKSELDAVESELDELSTTGRTVEAVEADLSSVEDNIAQKETVKDKKQAELVSVRNTIEEIEELDDRISDLSDQITSLTEKLEEVKQVKQAYITVKEDTRKQYLSKINQYTHEIFSAIYENESYERIEIDSDYRITLYTTDGAEIEPSLTSGGESAIVNLALRAGVYRVITEAGNSSLPPFILDEPTTFLDTQHIGKLEALTETLRDWDIEQVFIVSHNEQLIESGDAVYNVEKPENSSEVTRKY